MIELNHIQLLVVFVIYTGMGFTFGWWLCRYRWQREITYGCSHYNGDILVKEQSDKVIQPPTEEISERTPLIRKRVIEWSNDAFKNSSDYWGYMTKFATLARADFEPQLVEKEAEITKPTGFHALDTRLMAYLLEERNIERNRVKVLVDAISYAINSYPTLQDHLDMQRAKELLSTIKEE